MVLELTIVLDHVHQQVVLFDAVTSLQDFYEGIGIRDGTLVGRHHDHAVITPRIEGETGAIKTGRAIEQDVVVLVLMGTDDVDDDLVERELALKKIHAAITGREQIEAFTTDHALMKIFLR